MAAKLKTIIRNFKKEEDLLDTCLNKSEDNYYLKRLIDEMSFIINNYKLTHNTKSYSGNFDDTVLLKTVEELWGKMSNVQRDDLINMSDGM